MFIIALIISAVTGGPVYALTSDRAIRFAAAALTGEIGFIIAVPLWVRVVRSAPLSLLGAPRRPKRDLIEGAVAGLLLVVAGAISIVVVNSIARAVLGHDPTTRSQVPDYLTGPVLAVVGFSVIVAAPLGEELFFRGFLYRGLRQRLSVRLAVVTSAILFGLVHLLGGLGFWAIVAPLAVVGAGLAFVYERRQSLLASVTAHAVFNLVGFVAILASRWAD